MPEIKNENYVTIQAFMVNDLELSGNELIAYALIYGFSQDGESCFKGSLSYVAKWLNCSKTTAHSILNNLAEDGFLLKKEKNINGIKLCDYIALKPDKDSIKRIKENKKKRKEKEKSERRSKNLNTHSKNLNGGVQKTLTHNNIDILNDININPKSSTAKALEDNIPSSFQRNKGNRSSKNQLTEGDTEYTKPEIHNFLKQKIHEQMEYSEVGFDKYFESCITPIVIYFYDSYNETFIEQHPVLSNIAYRKIIDAYLNPPKVMENADIDFETYKKMIDKYFQTDIGKRSGKKIDYHMNHFMGKQVREYVYRRIVDAIV